MKKGFTLIELLAVIVILAIIALIAVPIVIDIISDSKENAQLRSADFYLDAVEFSVANSTLNNKKITSGTYFIMGDGNICLGTLTDNTCDGEVLEVEVKGETPTSGTITILNGEISDISLVYGDKTIIKNEKDELVYLKQVIKEGMLAYEILKKYGGADAIAPYDFTSEKQESWKTIHVDELLIYYDKSTIYRFATDYKLDSETGEYSLLGTMVDATLEECINGTKNCGRYFVHPVNIADYVMNNRSDIEIVGPYDKAPYLVDVSSFSCDGEEPFEGFRDSASYCITAKVYETTSAYKKMKYNGEVIQDGLYKMKDNYGDSYYFAGLVTDNYVKFGSWKETISTGKIYGCYSSTDSSSCATAYESIEACESVKDNYGYSVCKELKYASENDDMYWRIVRINGDGTIRLIYAGVQPYENGYYYDAYITPTQVQYNSDPSDVKYETSNAKDVLENWYKNNLLQDYDKYIADNIFCNDTSIYSDKLYHYLDEFEYPKNRTIFYGGGARHILYETPKLFCDQASDRLTVSNGKLVYPVGLLTEDELDLAGVYYKDGLTSSYLSYFPTLIMTPTYQDNVVKSNHLKPVINLKADVKFTGTGEIGSPYEIVME